MTKEKAIAKAKRCSQLDPMVDTERRLISPAGAHPAKGDEMEFKIIATGEIIRTHSEHVSNHYCETPNCEFHSCYKADALPAIRLSDGAHYNAHIARNDEWYFVKGR